MLGFTGHPPLTGESASRRLAQSAPVCSNRWGQVSQNALRLMAIPSELIHSILMQVSVRDLVNLSATNQEMRKYAISDYQWQLRVQDNVPCQTVTTPGPCTSYRELYAAHDLAWFLPKYKIWFCDQDLTGKLIVVRFDQRRGCIEGYRLLAASNQKNSTLWSADERVTVHEFEPQVKLHLDKPVLQFRVRDGQEKKGPVSSRHGANRFAEEMPMSPEIDTGGLFSNFLLVRPLDPEVTEKKLAASFPYENIWPPPAIPARQHASRAQIGQIPDDRPRSRPEVSEQIFRIREWMEMSANWVPSSLTDPTGSLVQRRTRVHIGEEVVTYSTLDPVHYMPTRIKPWRGIWVGDYGGHGCEFVLINQPDDAEATDGELGLRRGEAEAEEAWQQRRLEARIYRGRLEAVKLTGDPNVPRGEYTFRVDDLGPGGYMGVATEAPFIGARVVRGKGHVGGEGFVDDKFIESQLFLISQDRIAHHWVGCRHIIFFERVQIDKLGVS